MRIKNLRGGQWGLIKKNSTPSPWKRRKTTLSATFYATGVWRSSRENNQELKIWLIIENLAFYFNFMLWLFPNSTPKCLNLSQIRLSNRESYWEWFRYEGSAEKLSKLSGIWGNKFTSNTFKNKNIWILRSVNFADLDPNYFIKYFGLKFEFWENKREQFRFM